MEFTDKKCICGSGQHPFMLFDGHNIFLCYACDSCREERLSHYRPDIMSQYWCEEPIEPDE